MTILVKQKKNFPNNLKQTKTKQTFTALICLISLCILIPNLTAKSLKSTHCLKHHHFCKHTYKSDSSASAPESYLNTPDSFQENLIQKDSLTKQNESPMDPMNTKSSFISVATKSLQEAAAETPKLCCKENPKITLFGSARTALKTDLIRIGVQVDTKRPNAQQALQINTQTSNAVTNALTANGVATADITTVNFSLTPQYIWVPDPNSANMSIQKFDGYLVSNFIDVRTNKVNLAGKIIDLAVENGAKMINYVNFEILPETMETAKRLLIKSAVEDALQKAKEVLDPLNYQVAEISSINLSEISPIFRRVEEDRETEGKAADVAVAVGGAKAPVVFNNEREVNANVKVVFLIERKATESS